MENRIHFRGFKNVDLLFGAYPNGSIKVELHADTQLLAVLTEETSDISILDGGCIVVKNSSYAEDVLGQMLGLNLIDYYFPRMEEGGSLKFIAGLNRSFLCSMQQTQSQFAVA